MDHYLSKFGRPMPVPETVPWPASAFGQVIAEGGGGSAAVLVGPRLLITIASSLLEAEGLRSASFFQTACYRPVAIVRAWRVGFAFALG